MVEDAPTAPAPKRARTTLANRIVVALLCALLGFAVVLQVQRTAAGDTLATARPDDLVQILDGLQRREDDLNVEIAELQATLGRLQRSGASSEEALAEAERQAEALGILTGTVPATGPGVSIVIRDPDGRIPPEVMLDAIQELRNAGAEAFQVGPVRIGVDSAFTGSGGDIAVDGVALVAPYTVTAIGDPPDARRRTGHPRRGVRHGAAGGRDDGRHAVRFRAGRRLAAARDAALRSPGPMMISAPLAPSHHTDRKGQSS